MKRLRARKYLDLLGFRDISNVTNVLIIESAHLTLETLRGITLLSRIVAHFNVSDEFCRMNRIKFKPLPSPVISFTLFAFFFSILFPFQFVSYFVANDTSTVSNSQLLPANVTVRL